MANVRYAWPCWCPRRPHARTDVQRLRPPPAHRSPAWPPGWALRQPRGHDSSCSAWPDTGREPPRPGPATHRVPRASGQGLRCGPRAPSDLRLCSHHRIINGGRPGLLTQARTPRNSQITIYGWSTKTSFRSFCRVSAFCPAACKRETQHPLPCRPIRPEGDLFDRGKHRQGSCGLGDEHGGRRRAQRRGDRCPAWTRSWPRSGSATA